MMKPSQQKPKIGPLSGGGNKKHADESPRFGHLRVSGLGLAKESQSVEHTNLKPRILAMKNQYLTIGPPSFCITILSYLLCVTSAHAESAIHTFRLPDGAMRAQAAVDATGKVHIVHQNAKVRGELLYVTHDAKKASFSKPVAVLQDAKAMAAGFNMTVSPKGRVHVITRPNPKYSKLVMGDEAFQTMFQSKQRFFVLRYMLHSRLNDAGTAFEKETNLVGETIGFEGVGAVAVHPKTGWVHAFWAGQTEPGPEMGRDLYMATSSDEGAHWSDPVKLDVDILGNCRCCPIQATIDANGVLHVVQRNSVKTSATSWDKDTYWLSSTDEGRTWSKQLVQKWENCGCPGAPYSMAQGPKDVVFGFQTRGVASFAHTLDPTASVAAPDSGSATSRPVVAVNQKGEVLFCWTEAQDVVWQLYDDKSQPVTGKGGRLEGVAAKWSQAALATASNGDFHLYYDGVIAH